MNRSKMNISSIVVDSIPLKRLLIQLIFSQETFLWRSTLGYGMTKILILFWRNAEWQMKCLPVRLWKRKRIDVLGCLVAGTWLSSQHTTRLVQRAAEDKAAGHLIGRWVTALRVGSSTPRKPWKNITTTGFLPPIHFGSFSDSRKRNKIIFIEQLKSLVMFKQTTRANR